MNEKTIAFLTKMMWMLIPMIIGFFIWLVTINQSHQVDLAVVKNQYSYQTEMIERTYKMSKETKDLLSVKADNHQNTLEHKQLMEGLDKVNKKVDQVYVRLNLLYKEYAHVSLLQDSTYLWKDYNGWVMYPDTSYKNYVMAN